MHPDWLNKPVRLSSNNFTPLERTPWAGTAISALYKSEWAPPGTHIGESWEFSCDPAFPSQVIDHKMSLLDVFTAFPKACFGPVAQPSCEILVKLLNASSPLSLQVHPSDDDPNLKPGECGKPESWLVLDVEPGCGLYLGFEGPLKRDDLAQILRLNEDIRSHLQFVPVAVGDYFEIKPGVVHAVGAGVTLLEPQRIIPGLSGKTFRFWDWQRTYDDNGFEDPKGRARALHLEEALPLVDPEQQTGSQFVERLRRYPQQNTGQGWESKSYPRNDDYQVHVLQSTEKIAVRIALDKGYIAGVVLSGKCRFGDQEYGVGSSLMIPYAAFPSRCTMESGTTIAFVHPSFGTLSLES